MLDLLDKYGIKATYFAESWSLDVYRSVAKDQILARGHEIAWHGWQHEVWHSLSEEDEKSNFQKSFDKAREHSIQNKGFRPPGGKVNDRTYKLLKDNGVEYLSPLGGPADFGILDSEGEFERSGLVVLPFEWQAVDAFYYMEKFSGIREEYGAQREVMEPAEFERVLLRRIAETAKEGGYLSILFHPFLQLSEEKFEVLERVLQRIAENEEIWCAPCEEVARWVVENKETFPVVRIAS